ncbi:TPA: erythromycin resistance leader peptide [Streptococcus agalactiae]
MFSIFVIGRFDYQPNQK